MDTPYSVIERDEVDSTQDVARGGFSGAPLLVIAARQRRGRGRAGAGWESAPRAVAVSLAIAVEWPPSRLTLVPLVAGLVAAEMLDLGLKWPNDLLRGEAKVGGILVERDERAVVIGMGLNLHWPYPPDGVAAVHDHDPGAGAGADLARGWADRMVSVLSGSPETVDLDAYRRRSVTLGRAITWEPAGEGTAVDVADDGALLVETAMGTTRLTAGAVRHVRAQPSSDS